MVSVATTKLLAPQMSAGLFRTRLINLLDNCKSRLILIHAGAGYGKTSLTGSFVQHSNLPHIWYQLDKDDEEQTVFLRHLQHSCKMLQEKHSFLYPEPQNRILNTSYKNLKEFLPDFINFLNSSTNRVLIVLEDYHLVKNSKEVNQFLEQFILYMPSNLQLIITTRIKPAFSTAAFRAKGLLTEISQEQLKFDKKEAEELLGSLSLTRENIHKIWEQTEGWAAGLFLAKYAVTREKSQKHQIIPSNFQAYTVEYLQEEILSGIPHKEIEFLELTSILDFLHPEICDKLADVSDSAEKLFHLADNNLFVNLLEDGITYRYHQILRDYLQKRLKRRLDNKELLALHKKAAEIYFGRNEKINAAGHLFLARDYNGLERLIVEMAPELMEQGSYIQLCQIIKKLPSEIVEKSPQLLYYLGSNEFTIGTLHQVSINNLTRARELFIAQNENKGALQCALSLAAVYSELGEGRSVEKWAKIALKNLKT
ncbi:MAG: hypothetical protein AB1420_16830 [Bacillota bacterium]